MRRMGLSSLHVAVMAASVGLVAFGVRQLSAGSRWAAAATIVFGTVVFFGAAVALLARPAPDRTYFNSAQALLVALAATAIAAVFAAGAIWDSHNVLGMTVRALAGLGAAYIAGAAWSHAWKEERRQRRAAAQQRRAN